MLRINQNSSSAGAQSYYTQADYYTAEEKLGGQELVGVWRGQGAAKLGLSGNVDKADWDALCDNRYPGTNLPLTPRKKSERRIGYDFNFHVPKSVSLLYSLTRDEQLLDAFRESVRDTMTEMESEMQTRVRKSGKNEDRTTGNMVWGEFVHFTSRPIDGVPDPHLHAHCFVFNTTFDKQEDKWKAGQFSSLKRDAPYFEARFHVRLARRLGELGLDVTRTKKGWELTGLDKKTLDKFSRRTALIEEEARRKGILDPEEKSELGAKTREKKQKELTLNELRVEWLSRLTDDERDQLDGLKCHVGAAPVPEQPDLAPTVVQQAISHGFERKSVLPERTLLADALKRGIGKLSIATTERAVQEQNLLTADQDGRRWVTTREVLAEEQKMIHFARSGRGTQLRLGNGQHTFKRTWLNKDQQRAVEHILNSRDRVVLIRGAAGVGKTTMMQEAVEGIEASGQRVFVFAPSADASRGTLRAEGFENAETVAKLMLDENLHREVQGQVIWIDEAGLLGTKQMAQLFDLAEKLEARVVLSGDKRQHGSVERGAALRLLEEEAGLVPAEIREIQRQKGDYKQAVHALSEGRIEDGFRMLDKLGWVKEVPREERYQALASEYVATLAQGKTALVVSPTHKEGDQITTEIRDRLKRSGQLRGEEHVLQKLESMNLTEVERSEAEQYTPGDVIEFHQNAKGFTKGDRVTVPSDVGRAHWPVLLPSPSGRGAGGEGRAGRDRSINTLRDADALPAPQVGPLDSESPATLPLEHAKRFQAYRPREISLASGDLIRITKNGQTIDQKHRLNNGSIYRVASFDQRGNVVLDNGWTVSKEFGHFTHGYVMTSHASQGKTVDHVFIGESAQSLPAASREQFYVSASRGREQVTIYTDNKSQLLDAVQKGDNRLTATELVTSDHQRRLATMRKQVIRHHAFQRPTVPPRLPPNPSRHQALDRGG